MHFPLLGLAVFPHKVPVGFRPLWGPLRDVDCIKSCCLGDRAPDYRVYPLVLKREEKYILCRPPYCMPVTHEGVEGTAAIVTPRLVFFSKFYHQDSTLILLRLRKL